MQSFLSKNIFLLFWLVALADIIAVGTGSSGGHAIFKPVLIPLLICALLFRPSSGRSRKFVFPALVFAFVGDILLLKEGSSALFFILGLASFLIAHIFYCCYFISCKEPGTSLLARKPYLAIAVLCYAGGLVLLLLPHLGELAVPVIVYALVLAAMVISCLYAYNSLEPKVRGLFITGAIFFVLSDSILAINKFYSPFWGAPSMIMVTYILAQYLIVSAVIKNDR